MTKKQKGKEYRKQKVFNTKREAKTWEVKMKKLSVEDWLNPTGTTSLGDWVNECLNFAKAHYTGKTYKEKAACFKLLFAAVDPALPAQDLE